MPSLDIKWRPRADVVVDATINPDFSQVELDTPQVAGNAQFALFFPEKRPFFLEGADILQSPFNALYTRSVTDPSWGARGTQRAERFDGTVLVTRRRRRRARAAAQHLRHRLRGAGLQVGRDLRARPLAGGRRRRVGVLATDRTLEDGRGYNRVAGPDFAWFPTTEHRVRAQVLGSWTTALPDAQGGRSRRASSPPSHAALRRLALQQRAVGPVPQLRGRGPRLPRRQRLLRPERLPARLQRDRAQVPGRVGLQRGLAVRRTPSTRPIRDGNVQYQQNNLGVRLGLPRATTHLHRGARQQPRGGARRRAGCASATSSSSGSRATRSRGSRSSTRSSPYGDRVDVANNRVGKGAFVTVQASLRPHPRAELEYRIDNDTIDSIEAGRGLEAHHHASARSRCWRSGTSRARDSVRDDLAGALDAPRAVAVGAAGVSREKSDTAVRRLRPSSRLDFTVVRGRDLGRTERRRRRLAALPGGSVREGLVDLRRAL